MDRRVADSDDWSATNMSNAKLTAIAIAVMVTGFAGCEPIIYRAETVIKPDGSVSRAIYQPIEATPQEARESKAWQATTYAGRIAHHDWTGKIEDLPRAKPGDDRSYFAAWGDFKSPDELPQAFVKKAPAGLPDGRLALEYEREDLGLVVAYRWKETLTDM
jgi:hypothetical protein